MVDSDRGYPLLPLCGLPFPVSSKGSFIYTILVDMIEHKPRPFKKNNKKNISNIS